jgi:hypothetical protein
MRRWVRLSFSSLIAAVLCFSIYFTADLNAHTASAAYSARHSNAMTALQADLKAHLDLREQAFTLKYRGQTNGLSSQMDKAVQAVLDADDSLGYTVSSYRWNTSFTQNEASIKVQVAYWENAKQTAYVVAQTQQIAQQMIKPDMNAHEKVKAIHDWVLLHVAYDTTMIQHSAYAALTSGRTVCQGYALLTYRLLNEAGIPDRIVEGTVSSGLHAWNLVNLDGKWYHLDTTFDDPVPDLRGRTTYNYYLLTDKQMRKDHRWTKVYPAAATPYADTLTALKSTDPAKAAFYGSLEHSLGYAFLKPENTVKNTDQLAAKIATAIEGGKNSVRVRWTGSPSSLNLQRLLGGVPGLSSVKYTKTPFPQGNPGDVILLVQFK